MQTLKHMLGIIHMNSPIKVIYYYFYGQKKLHLELSKINATIIFYNLMNTYNLNILKI